MPTRRPPIIEDLGRATGVGALLSAGLGYPVWLLGASSMPGLVETVYWLGAMGTLGLLAWSLGLVSLWCASALYGDGVDGTELARFFAAKATAAALAALPLVGGAGWGIVGVLG